MLRRIVRLFLYLVAVVVLAAVGGVAYLFLALPRVATASSASISARVVTASW